MASFTENDFNQLDWSLLQNGSIKAYWQTAVLDGDVEWLRANGYSVREFRCLNWQSSGTMFEELGTTLNLSNGVPNGFDALADDLLDVPVSASGGLALVFRHFDSFHKAHPIEAQTLLDVLERRSRGFLLLGRRLITLFHSSDPKIEFSPVGASPVLWNPKEWLNSSRGL